MRDRNRARNYMNGQQGSITLQTLTKDEPSYLAVFAKHRHIYDLFNRSGEMINFFGDIQDELLIAYREATGDVHYNFTRTCPACIAEFLCRVYNWYDKNK